jgi:hypothetical protein
MVCEPSRGGPPSKYVVVKAIGERVLIMKRTLIIAACVSTLSANANANLLVNGSFESGSFSDQGNDTMSLFVGSTAITGWTVIGTTVGASLAWIGPTSPWNLSAEDGNYFLDLTDYTPFGPYGGVSQTFATTAGHKYEVTFWLGSSPQWGLQDGLTVSAGGTSKTFTSTNSGTQVNLWQAETFDFAANGSSTTVSLLGASGDNYIGVDNVVATDLGGAVVATGGAVPEPSTWAMMVLGFAGLGYLGYRRRRKGRRWLTTFGSSHTSRSPFSLVAFS